MTDSTPNPPDVEVATQDAKRPMERRNFFKIPLRRNAGVSSVAEF